MIEQQPDKTSHGDTTHERIAKGESYIGQDGARRFIDAPLLRMAAKGDLDPDPKSDDPPASLLVEAGERYYEAYYTANMNPLAAFDPTRVFSGGGESGGGMPVSERQAAARHRIREIVAKVQKRFLSVVDAIVIHERGDLVAIGREASGKSSDHACRAVAVERLVAGLTMIAGVFGLIKIH